MHKKIVRQNYKYGGPQHWIRHEGTNIESYNTILHATLSKNNDNLTSTRAWSLKCNQILHTFPRQNHRLLMIISQNVPFCQPNLWFKHRSPLTAVPQFPTTTNLISPNSHTTISPNLDSFTHLRFQFTFSNLPLLKHIT